MLRVQRQESGRERGLITKGVGTVITNIFEICENVYFVPKSRLKHSLSSRRKKSQLTMADEGYKSAVSSISYKQVLGSPVLTTRRQVQRFLV